MLPDFQNVAQFSNFCPIFKFFPNFQIFVGFSNFFPIFKFLSDFQIFSRFSNLGTNILINRDPKNPYRQLLSNLFPQIRWSMSVSCKSITSMPGWEWPRSCLSLLPWSMWLFLVKIISTAVTSVFYHLENTDHGHSTLNHPVCWATSKIDFTDDEFTSLLKKYCKNSQVVKCENHGNFSNNSSFE